MKKIAKPISLIVAASMLAVTVYADEIKDGFQQLLQNYIENSPSYKTIELQNEKNKADDYSNSYSLKSAEENTEDNQKQIESLEYQLSIETDYYKKSSLRSNIEYRKIYTSELELNKAELELESAFNEISEEFSEASLEIEKKNFECDIRTKLNNLTALKKQLSYLELQEQYCTENIDITKSSLEIGYATGLDVKNAEAQLAQAKAAVAGCQMQISKIEKDIELNSGKAPSLPDYKFLAECDLSENELLEQFKETSPQEEIFEKQAQAYRDLIKKITDIKRTLNEYQPKESEDNTKYKERLSERVEGALAYYNNELEIMENNIKSYEISLELYVSELFGKIAVCTAEISASEAALKAAETNIDVMKAFYAEGHVRPIDMTEADVKHAKAEYDLISAQISLDNVIFIIENSIIVN